MPMHIHSASAAVADQDASLGFYVEKLGWEKAADSPISGDMRWVTVVPPGGKTELALVDIRWFEGGVAPSKNTGISIVTTDIEGDYATWSERGVRFKGPVERMPWGDKATWFYDIDDNEFYLIETVTQT